MDKQAIAVILWIISFIVSSHLGLDLTNFNNHLNILLLADSIRGLLALNFSYKSVAGLVCSLPLKSCIVFWHYMNSGSPKLSGSCGSALWNLSTTSPSLKAAPNAANASIFRSNLNFYSFTPSNRSLSPVKQTSRSFSVNVCCTY